MFNNNFTSNSESEVLLESLDTSEVRLELKGNLFTGHLLDFAVHLQARNSSRFCLDMSDNPSDNSYRLTRMNALFQVKERDDLELLNTGGVIFDGEPLQDLEDGVCGF